MKKNFIAFFKGFSLIELLISLIIISCIVAAFAPIMTKRLQGGAITLGGEKITSDCSAAFSSDCKLCSGKKACLLCQKTASTCPLGQFLDPAKCKCVTCVVGGYCKSCDNGTSCKTCPTDRVLEGGKCTKTCGTGLFAPDNNALTSCSNCDAKCSNCSGSATNCNYQCKDNKYYGANCANSCPSSCNDGKCDAHTGGCVGGCKPGYGGTTTCTACGPGKEVNTSTHTCKTCNPGYYSTQAANQTCSPCGIGQQHNSTYTGCTSCTGNTMNTTIGGVCLDPSNFCGANQTYNDNHNGCKDCSTIHGNCTKCEGNSCSECNGDYVARNGKCEKKSAICSFTYNGSNYTIENAVKYTASGKTYCMTSTNIGDGAYASIPNAAGISPITSPSSTCGAQKCCWKHGSTAGSTGTPSPNPGFDYAPQGRTVCNWWAAMAVCSKISSPISSKSWHLPSISEFGYLKTAISAESSGSCTSTPKSGNIQQCAGKAGLQLCGGSSGYGSPYCNNSNSCQSSNGYNYCYPYGLWSSTEDDSDYADYANFSGSSLSTGNGYYKYNGLSVRCVLGPL